MSDSEEEEAPSVKWAKTLAGSIAERQKAAMEKLVEAKGEGDSVLMKREEGGSKANVHVSNEYFALDKIVDHHKEAMLAEFEKRKRARKLTLPVDDLEVRMLLRRLDQPACLFGEMKPDRRERLKALLADKDDDEVQQILHKEEALPTRGKEDESTWYHEGPPALREARLFIAKYSLPRAKRRLEKARSAKLVPSQERALKLQETHKWMRNVTIYGSQIGDLRPISFCEFSPNSAYIATASWTGLCKLWSVPECKPIRSYRGHNSQAGCIRFHPMSTKGALDPGVLNLASCAHDGSVFLWSLESDEPLADLEGHAPYRVSRLAFHPSGRFLATCCHDCSWRLFDLEANEEVLFQEGHSKAVFDIDFQCDGSVALSGGMDGYGRVWDLRTGRCIMFLEGHQNSILSVNFAPNGYQMGSGSADNSVKIWDLRMRRCIYTVPAHKNLISQIKYDSSGRDYLLTGSYDNTIKIWTNPGYQQLKCLQGHESKVMCVDVSPDGKWIASSSYDRTFKLWAPDAS